MQFYLRYVPQPRISWFTRARFVRLDTAKSRFGWKLAGTGGQAQGGYQVIVASTSGAAGNGTGDVWDSGHVASGQSVDVSYDGPALTSQTRYYWRVRIWDTQGRPSGWGAVRFFETGLISSATEWQGAFIGQPGAAGLNGATWIWYPEGDPAAGVPAATRYFRRTVSLASAPTAASLVITGDDTADVWVNGVQVSTSPRAVDSWKTAAVIDVTGRLHAGANTIAVSGQNTSQSPAAVIGQLTVSGAAVASTDATWKASQTGPAGWEQPGFNDTAWVAARAVAGYGSGPWGARPAQRDTRGELGDHQGHQNLAGRRDDPEPDPDRPGVTQDVVVGAEDADRHRDERERDREHLKRSERPIQLRLIAVSLGHFAPAIDHRGVDRTGDPGSTRAAGGHPDG